ncbi:hypothetical protein CP533_3682 [Ophiocordyceps camponoti-saundersi (nom. inval.)]|nr:hypothetical protein CP533_3682 [Ophiocordyceps camponoti-saundersi (nom. inval.)]
MDLNDKYDDYDFPHTAAEKKDGHAGHLTPDQIAKVHQLRMMLESEGYTERLDTLTLVRLTPLRLFLFQRNRNCRPIPRSDVTLTLPTLQLRFLRARKFDVAQAKQMFVDCEKWRKDTKLDDDVPNWTYPEKKDVAKYYKQFYHKTDKVSCSAAVDPIPPYPNSWGSPHAQDGRPIYIETLGGIDLKAMYEITTSERMLTNLAVEYERLADPRLPACSRKAGNLIETCCTVMDLKGISLTKMPQVRQYVNQVSVISQNYYPERLGKLYLINAPWGFSTVWNIIKGWLDPVTVAKINILGSGYKTELLKQIPAENLPKEFGGTCECPGECENSDAGPWRDPAWAKPAKWESKVKKETDDKVSEDKNPEVEAPAGKEEAMQPAMA